MSCNFKVPFVGSAEEILNKTKTAVESQGGIFEGDQFKGNFSVSLLSNTVEGSYSVIGNELELDIQKKPGFLPCSAIESVLVKKLG
jgi:hypothetical protein